MKNSDIAKEMHNDFLETYFKAIKSFGKEAPYIKKPIIIEKAINSQAKKFYVSSFETQRIISQMDRNKCNKKFSPERKEMYFVLLTNFKKWKKENPGKPISRGIEEIISQPAPKFYLSKSYAYNMVCKLINKKI